MAFTLMGFPWLVLGCDDGNSPNIYDGARFPQSGFSSYSGGSGTDMELDDGSAVLYADVLTLTFPDGSKKIFRSVHFGLSGGLWTSHNNFEYVAPPAPPSPDYSNMTVQELLNSGIIKVPYNKVERFTRANSRFYGNSVVNGYPVSVWWFSSCSFWSIEFKYQFNLSDVYIAFLLPPDSRMPWEEDFPAFSLISSK